MADQYEGIREKTPEGKKPLTAVEVETKRIEGYAKKDAHYTVLNEIPYDNVLGGHKEVDFVIKTSFTAELLKNMFGTEVTWESLSPAQRNFVLNTVRILTLRTGLNMYSMPAGAKWTFNFEAEGPGSYEFRYKDKLIGGFLEAPTDATRKAILEYTKTQLGEEMMTAEALYDLGIRKMMLDTAAGQGSLVDVLGRMVKKVSLESRKEMLKTDIGEVDGINKYLLEHFEKEKKLSGEALDAAMAKHRVGEAGANYRGTAEQNMAWLKFLRYDLLGHPNPLESEEARAAREAERAEEEKVAKERAEKVKKAKEAFQSQLDGVEQAVRDELGEDADKVQSVSFESKLDYSGRTWTIVLTNVQVTFSDDSETTAQKIQYREQGDPEQVPWTALELADALLSDIELGIPGRIEPIKEAEGVAKPAEEPAPKPIVPVSTPEAVPVAPPAAPAAPERPVPPAAPPPAEAVSPAAPAAPTEAEVKAEETERDKKLTAAWAMTEAALKGTADEYGIDMTVTPKGPGGNNKEVYFMKGGQMYIMDISVPPFIWDQAVEVTPTGKELKITDYKEEFNVKITLRGKKGFYPTPQAALEKVIDELQQWSSIQGRIKSMAGKQEGVHMEVFEGEPKGSKEILLKKGNLEERIFVTVPEGFKDTLGYSRRTGVRIKTSVPHIGRYEDVEAAVSDVLGYLEKKKVKEKPVEEVSPRESRQVYNKLVREWRPLKTELERVKPKDKDGKAIEMSILESFIREPCWISIHLTGRVDGKLELRTVKVEIPLTKELLKYENFKDFTFSKDFGVDIKCEQTNLPYPNIPEAVNAQRFFLKNGKEFVAEPPELEEPEDPDEE